MDIDLLSKMVKELILDNDRVVLPGFGAFVAEIVPSTFSDKGYTINPPYRKLYFRNRAEDDMKLIEFYASSNNVELAVADKVIRDFVSELQSVLFARKTVVFPGLGRMRATKENAVFFVTDEDLDIYPEGFGLEPISLKTHVETREEISQAVAELKAIVTEPVAEQEETPEAEGIELEPEELPEEIDIEIIEEPVSEMSEDAQQEEAADEGEETEVAEPADVPAAKRSGWKAVWISLLCLVIAAVLLLGAFMAVAHWAPELLDTILYTPEELEILNHQ